MVGDSQYVYRRITTPVPALDRDHAHLLKSALGGKVDDYVRPFHDLALYVADRIYKGT
jgi:hypothetical protein